MLCVHCMDTGTLSSNSSGGIHVLLLHVKCSLGNGPSLSEASH